MQASCRSERRRRWRVRAVLTLGVAALWLGGPWSAPLGAQMVLPTPPSPGDFPGCIQGQLIARSGAGPDLTDRNYFEDPDTLLNAVWVCAGFYADARIVPIGQALLGGLVIIMFIWTGVGFMFSGELDFGALLGTLFLAGLGFMMLDNYFFASPAAVPFLPAGERTNGFVAMFPDQALAWGDMIMGSADEQFQRAYTEARESGEEAHLGRVGRVAGDPDRVYADASDSPDEAEGIAALLRRMEFEVRMFMMSGLHWVMAAILWLIGWMIYAQYVWGFFTLAVLTILGPLFIPWMMITQLDFLFWGWLKAMINGVIYMLTAAALYAGVAMLLVSPLQRLAQAPLSDDPMSILASAELMIRMYVEYLPLVIMSLFAALKVNAISGMLVAGGTPPGSGLGSGLTKAEAAAGAMAGWQGLRGGQDTPVSQQTGGGRQKAGEAWREGRRRAGGGPKPGGGGPTPVGGGPKPGGGGSTGQGGGGRPKTPRERLVDEIEEMDPRRSASAVPR